MARLRIEFDNGRIVNRRYMSYAQMIAAAQRAALLYSGVATVTIHTR
jgi:hypothetical protein